MEINELVTTPTEEIILEHMVGILEAVKRIQPDHGIISLGITDGYFDLMCGGENIFDKFNFTMRVTDKDDDESCISRYVPGTPDHDRKTSCFNTKDVKAYLWDAKRTRIDYAVKSNGRIRAVKDSAMPKGNPYHNTDLIGHYPEFTD